MSLFQLVYCTVTAPASKLLKYNGAGEGNRTLVTDLGGLKWFITRTNAGLSGENAVRLLHKLHTHNDGFDL